MRGLRLSGLCPVFILDRMGCPAHFSGQGKVKDFMQLRFIETPNKEWVLQFKVDESFGWFNIPHVPIESQENPYFKDFKGQNQFEDFWRGGQWD